jgi:hypothetical protein
LYLEGLARNQTWVSVTISNWVKSFNIKPSRQLPTYRIFNHLELIEYIKTRFLLSGAGMIITELGDKFMLIKWEGSRTSYIVYTYIYQIFFLQKKFGTVEITTIKLLIYYEKNLFDCCNSASIYEKLFTRLPDYRLE